MMMKKIALGVSVAMGLSVCAQVWADDTSSGCGLGWQVTRRQSLVSSAIRNTTNVFLPNTFSMTFGTSGCARHELVKNDEKAVYYAVNNKDSLLVEMAQGKGEFLAGFAASLGCGASDASRLASLAQSHYEAIAAQGAQDGIALYRSVRLLMMTDPVLSASCQNASTQSI